MKKVLYILSAIATLVSCQKEVGLDTITSPLNNSLTISVLSESATTRMEFTDEENGVTLDWDSEDVFTVYTTDGDRVADYQFHEKNSDGTVTFIPTDNSITLSEEVEYMAIYPAVDDITTPTEHREELESRIAMQTQNGNNDKSHLDSALRMEAEFSYSASSNTVVTFEHKTAIMRITFELIDNAVPMYATFVDGDFVTYTINFDNATSSDSHTANFVIKPNETGVSRKLEFVVTSVEQDSYFSVETDTKYYAGVQYRSSIASSGLYRCIYTKEELIAYKDEVSGGNSSINAVLMADINLSGTTWTPIGTYSTSGGNSFKGVFDGNGYTISNLTISSTSSSYQGMFGYVVGGTIKNLILESSSIKGDGYIGIVCGSLESGGTISNCKVSGGTITGYDDSVGGVVGYAYSSTITSCSNTSTVKNSGTYDDYIGGIVGYAYLSTVTSCYNTGSVTGYYYSIGGIVGYARSSTIASCFNTGTIKGSNSSSDYVGGIAGTSYYSPITACYNSGSITGYDDYVGGIAGRGQISTSATTAITACYNIGAVSGDYYIGGVIGVCRFDSSYSYYYIDACYNTSLVSGGSSCVGGIAGSGDSSRITSCYFSAYTSAAYTNTYGTAKSSLEATMQASSFIYTLNTAAGGEYWEYDTNNINNGYPILIGIDYE